MRKTTREANTQKIAVDTKELQSMLCCGRSTALQIGEEAHARIQIGKRVLWNVAKIQSYMNRLSEGAVS